ncbi:hypothetical protein H5T87_08440 [bacterium]|nr:hypothetical protein [bacterium]
MRKILTLILLVNIAFSTIATDLRWETKNVVMDLKKLFGFPYSVLNEEIVTHCHFFRLAQSVMDTLKIKGKLYLECRLLVFSNPGIWIEFGKKRKRVQEHLCGLPDDFQFLKTLSEVLGRKLNPQKLLTQLHDKGAPSLSLYGDKISYKVWREGREAIVVEDWRGNILWKWGISQKEGYLPADPLLSPGGNLLCFLVGYTLFIKDFTNDRFYKVHPPYPRIADPVYIYDNPFFYPSDKFIVSGITVADIKKHWETEEVHIYIVSPKRIHHSLKLDLSETLNFLWAPDQEKLAIMFEGWSKRGKCHKDIWIVDVPKNRIHKFKVLPAYYTFIWNQTSNGIYLATKGKQKGEIFYLSMENGKISRIFKCGEGLEIFNLGNDGSLLLKKGKDKLLILKPGEKRKEIKASFYKFMLNQTASPGPCCCAEWVGTGCYALAGPFPTNCIEIAVADGIEPQKSELFSYPHNFQGERVWIRKVILTPDLYSKLREKIAKEHPIYWDINPKKGIAFLTSQNGGCNNLTITPFAEDTVSQDTTKP